MLADGRAEMVKQAIACFEAQTYGNAELLIYDTGTDFIPNDPHWYCPRPQHCGKTVGELRNLANRDTDYGDIIIHWDSDDWSHPNRIAEQVELLQAIGSGTECVGYREMLFWDGRMSGVWLYSSGDPRYCLGTSLCYWRSAWEKRSFEPTSQGEDARWLMGVKSAGISAYAPPYGMEVDSSPRMIARIHAGNTSNAYAPETMRRASEWRRAPEWDDYCREKMSLA